MFSHDYENADMKNIIVLRWFYIVLYYSRGTRKNNFAILLFLYDITSDKRLEGQRPWY